jgi:lipid-binding SYLF domain-containing protein
MLSLLKSAHTLLESVLTCDDEIMLGRSFWEQEDLKGILLLSVLEAGCLISRSVGTGLLFARRSNKPRQKSGHQQYNWSLPCAVNMGGYVKVVMS